MDTVLNAIGGMQAQIDALKRTASKSSMNMENNAENVLPLHPLPIPGMLSALQPVPAAIGPSLRGRSEGSEVLQAVKMMAAITYMQSVQSFFR